MVRLLNRLIEPTRGQVLMMVWILPKYPTPNSVRCAEKNCDGLPVLCLNAAYDRAGQYAFGMELAGINAEERREKALEHCVRSGWKIMPTATRMNSLGDASTCGISPRVSD